MSNTIQITKATGEKEAFQREKLTKSLRRPGTNYMLIADIVAEVEKWHTEGISTKNIYSKHFIF